MAEKKVKNIAELVATLVKDAVEDCGCSLWDVEFVKEGPVRTLTIYIDKPEGISLTDCETVNWAVDPIIDEADPIAESYNLEISSAGIERELKKKEHFEFFYGSECIFKFYKLYNGSKQLCAKLVSYDDETDTIVAEKEDGEIITLEKKECASIKNKADF